MITMVGHIQIELIRDDEPEEGEGIITADELFATIIEGLQRSQKWHKGSGTVRYNRLADGERIGPVEVTKEEYARFHCELGARRDRLVTMLCAGDSPLQRCEGCGPDTC